MRLLRCDNYSNLLGWAIDCGTMGHLGHCQVVLPYISEGYDADESEGKQEIETL